VRHTGRKSFGCAAKYSMRKRWCQRVSLQLGSAKSCDYEKLKVLLLHCCDKTHHLRNLLEPILVQLPPNWDVNIDRLVGFLKAAPGSVRWSFEFRDTQWLCDEVFAILQQHNTALCIHDMIENHPRRVTADWICLRFHGDHYSGSYTPQALKVQAQWIKQQLGEGKDVFAYFNNDAQGYAIGNAEELKRNVFELLF
jgi:uncharacterized protein YecE (DUF72 family)